MIIKAISVSVAAALALGTPVLTKSDAAVTAVATAAVCPAVSGHRGFVSEAPENSVQGIKAAKVAGAKYVEMDVQFDSSGYPRLLHDDTLDRTTNGKGKISAQTYTTVETYTAADYAPWNDATKHPETAGWTDSAKKLPRVKVPRAYDFFTAVNNEKISAILDMKAAPASADQASKLLQYITQYQLTSKIIVQGSEDTIKKMRTYSGYSALTYALIEFPTAVSATAPATNVKNPAYLRDVLKVKYYALAVKNITSKEFVDGYEAAGVHMITWSTESSGAYDNAANWANMTSYGVSVLTTNEPKKLADWELTVGC